MSIEEHVDDEIEEKGSERQMDLIDHLAELRNRLIRSALYVTVGAIIGWFFYDSFFKLISAPIIEYLKQNKSSFLLTGVAEGFTIKMQISLLVGVIIALPLITIEGWRFIAPGLTKLERRAVILVGPLSIVLFASGIIIAYKVLPVGIIWLANQNPPGAKFMPSVAQTLIFILKMYLAFGLVFQMPVVLMFLGKVGIISSGALKAYWRHAIVIIGIVAAMITPSGDAFTMIMMCAPMVVLYALSIGLVRLVEK